MGPKSIIIKNYIFTKYPIMDLQKLGFRFINEGENLFHMLFQCRTHSNAVDPQKSIPYLVFTYEWIQDETTFKRKNLLPQISYSETIVTQILQTSNTTWQHHNGYNECQFILTPNHDVFFEYLKNDLANEIIIELKPLLMPYLLSSETSSLEATSSEASSLADVNSLIEHLKIRKEHPLWAIALHRQLTKQTAPSSHTNIFNQSSATSDYFYDFKTYQLQGKSNLYLEQFHTNCDWLLETT